MSNTERQGQAIWPYESPFPEDSVNHAMWAIADAFNEATSDVSILFDAVWTKDLTLVDPEWREAQATQLDRERTQLNLLLTNAATILRHLTMEGVSDDN